MRRYAETLLDCAEYVNKFKTKQDFLEDLLKHYENKNFKDVVGYFRKQVRKGFSVALTCDFLKEFDIEFNDLPKPDIHIKDTLCEFYGYDKKYYDSSDDKVYECIKNFQDLTKKNK